MQNLKDSGLMIQDYFQLLWVLAASGCGFFSKEKKPDCYVLLICLNSHTCLFMLQGAKGSASLKFDTEKEVFDFLGFPWLEPHERNL